MRPLSFAMAGGGTGGHVVPNLAVARELRRRGHQPFFIGTQRGLEARLVPRDGFPIEWIEIGGLNRVSAAERLRTLWRLPLSIVRAYSILSERSARGVFSMGGYAAGPVMIAAWLQNLPIIAMEPNAVPGFTSRRMAAFVERALLSFPEALRYFPRGSAELTGLPVREEFFRIPTKSRGETLNILITGGSRGSRTLNTAAAESWRLFRASGCPVRMVLQTGPEAHEALSRKFADAGIPGEVVPFVHDMPAAFAEADIVVARSGAGSVSELAAAGKPSVLVPFPFAADQHQLRNAEALQRIGAARLVLDGEMNGERLYAELTEMAAEPGLLERMGAAARAFAKPGAAARAADLLVELGKSV